MAGAGVAMAIGTPVSLGTVQWKTGSTGLSLTTSLAVGDLVVVCTAADTAVSSAIAANAGAGGANLSLTQAAVANNAGNVVLEIWYGVVLTATTSKTIDIGYIGQQAMAGAFYKVSGIASSPLDKTASSTGSGTSPSSGATATLSQADELVIGAIGVEDNVEDIAGSWTTGTGNVSGNEQQAGTTGGGSASNIVIRSAAEIVSATTAQTAGITGVASADWAACIATFKGAASGTPPGFDKWRISRTLMGVGF